MSTTRAITASTSSRRRKEVLTSSTAFISLPRVPLVPDELLKRHNVYCFIDTRFRRAARLLQAMWLKDHNIPSSASTRTIDNVTKTFGFASNLSNAAAEAGKNFIDEKVHQLVLRELLMREEGAAIDEERLFGNALSSMPMTFNLFGPLALDLKLATAVFYHLLPEFVHTVERIAFEHSPGRREARFLNDGTAFDVAVHVTTPEGEAGIIFCECKLSEDMTGPAARMRDRYNEASRLAHLYVDPESALLRSLALEQLWREHMLAQLVVDQGITSHGVFMAIGPRLNRRVMTAFKVYESELIHREDQDENRVAFEPVTLEAFVEAINAVGATKLASSLWQRYLDFGRIYDLALEEVGAMPDLRTNSSAKKNLPARSVDRSRRQLPVRPTSTPQHSYSETTNTPANDREAS